MRKTSVEKYNCIYTVHQLSLVLYFQEETIDLKVKPAQPKGFQIGVNRPNVFVNLSQASETVYYRPNI